MGRTKPRRDTRSARGPLLVPIRLGSVVVVVVVGGAERGGWG